jgi:hypothetical protein
MELVEGEDLSAHIARGAMPVAEAPPIARQIADALEAARCLRETASSTSSPARCRTLIPRLRWCHGERAGVCPFRRCGPGRSGWLLYARQGVLMAQEFDAKTDLLFTNAVSKPS